MKEGMTTNSVTNVLQHKALADKVISTASKNPLSDAQNWKKILTVPPEVMETGTAREITRALLRASSGKPFIALKHLHGYIKASRKHLSRERKKILTQVAIRLQRKIR